MEKRLWGGVFKEEVEGTLRKFLDSFSFDSRLAPEVFDITFVHSVLLSDEGFIPKDKLKEIFSSREKVIKAVLSSKPDDFEDVHSAVEYFIARECGEDIGTNVRAGRSRNDEVITAVYLWVMRESQKILDEMKSVFYSMLSCAQKYQDVIIPFMTHTRYAQPILFSHLILSYITGFLRCAERFRDVLLRFDVCHMGSGAGAGTSIISDIKKAAFLLGFSRISDNSLDSTGRRDTLYELIFVFSTFALLFSKIAEDLIFLSAEDIGFVEIGDKVCTGSSMMPQKKNPDTLELIRGKASKFLGYLASFFALEKGVVSGYSKDFQEDKKILFEAFDEFYSILSAVSQVFRNISAKKRQLPYHILATDVAEKIFREKKMSYREVHKFIGEHIKMHQKLPENLTFEESLQMKRTPQSTKPDFVREKMRILENRWRALKGNITHLISRFSYYNFEKRLINEIGSLK
jgi:argininosuccinate lyase